MGQIRGGGLRAIGYGADSDELRKPVADPDLRKKFADNGLQIVVGSKGDFDREIAADRLKWGKLIRDFNIKPEN